MTLAPSSGSTAQAGMRSEQHVDFERNVMYHRTFIGCWTELIASEIRS